MNPKPEAAAVLQSLNAVLAGLLQAARDGTGECVSIRIHNHDGAMKLYAITGVELISLEAESRKIQETLARFDRQAEAASTAPPDTRKS